MKQSKYIMIEYNMDIVSHCQLYHKISKSQYFLTLFGFIAKFQKLISQIFV